LLFAEDSLHLSECKEWNECAEYDHASGEQIIYAHFAKRCYEPLSMHEVFDGFFNDMEDEDQQAKHKCLINRRINQWLGLLLLTKVRVFPDENNLRDHQRVDQRSPIGEIRDLELVEQQHAVGRDGAKEKARYRKITARSSNSWATFRFISALWNFQQSLSTPFHKYDDVSNMPFYEARPAMLGIKEIASLCQEKAHLR
jgi:hypothetical protein